MALAILIAFVVVLLIIGVAMLAAGLRGRVIDGHPVCCECRFDLVGSVPGLTKCPECGALLSAYDAITIGNRVYQPFRVWVGSALLVLTVVLAVGFSMRSAGIAMLCRQLPTSMLQGFYKKQSWQPALTEIQQRFGTDRLTTSEIQSLTPLALQIQSAPSVPWDLFWGDVVERAHDNGTLTGGQWDQYLQTAFASTMVSIEPSTDSGRLAWRPMGTWWSVAFLLRPVKLGHSSNFEIRFRKASWTLGQSSGALEYAWHPVAADALSGVSFSYPLSVPLLAPGVYTASVTSTADVLYKGVVQCTITHKLVENALMQIVPPGTPMYPLISDDTAVPAMQQVFRQARLEVYADARGTRHEAELFASIGDLPYCLEAEIRLISTDRTERNYLTELYIKAHQPSSALRLRLFQVPDALVVEGGKSDGRVDLVLVPNSTMGNTPFNHMNPPARLWNREIVIRGVPVKVVKPQP